MAKKKPDAGTQHEKWEIKISVDVLRQEGPRSPGSTTFKPLEMGFLMLKMPHAHQFDGPIVLTKGRAEVDVDWCGLRGDWVLEASGFDASGSFYQGSAEVLIDPKNRPEQYEVTLRLAPS